MRGRSSLRQPRKGRRDGKTPLRPGAANGDPPAATGGQLPEDCGLILADRYGGEIVRPAKLAPAMAGARRKALTLRFARTAALRLAIRADPELGARAEAKDV